MPLPLVERTALDPLCGLVEKRCIFCKHRAGISLGDKDPERRLHWSGTRGLCIILALDWMPITR